MRCHPALFGVMLAAWGTAPLAAQTSGAACVAPDSKLLKSRGAYSGRAQLPDQAKVDLYNAQARAFNDCTRSSVDSGNDAMDRIRDEANARIRTLTDAANRQIVAMNARIRAAASGDVVPGSVETAFPAPACRKADAGLLKSGRGSGAARGEQYVRQEEAYQACIQDYVDRAAAENKRIVATANAEIRQTADDANARIANLRNNVRGTIDTANAVAQSRSQMVEGTPLAATDPVLQSRSAANPQENSQADPSLWPVVKDTPSGEGPARVITCRAPQRLADSQRLGPKVCKRNGVWAVLRKAGQDIGPDGKTVVMFDVTRRTEVSAPQQSQ